MPATTKEGVNCKEKMSKHEPKRKLRPLVITMGNARQAHIEALFAHPAMAAHFEPPTFSPGVPQRELRARYDLLTHAGKAGILPEAEWKALSSPEAKRLNEEDPVNLFDILDDVAVESGRFGSDDDVKLHYAREFWQKAKGINRGRSVLACSLANLIAQKKLVEEGFDFILEDNVRAPITNSSFMSLDENGELFCECAKRIREARRASEELEEDSGKKCHLRYYGWLGSRPNLEFILNAHCPSTKFQRQDDPDSSSVFPFPIQTDIENFLAEANSSNTGDTEEDEKKDDRTKPGGSPIWGSFAYWISKEGHYKLIESLQKDVGAFLWKAKKWRCYKVKPIDKILPRRIISAFSETQHQDGRDHVHVITHPAFFRAPMLTSQIHTKWDAEFCKSTEFQMKRCKQEHLSEGGDEDAEVLEWNHLWLTKEETQIVEYRKLHHKWISLKELEELSNKE